ncbi:SDR family NAD(P)-dependent oxidoreductase [Palleronia caenipelagi]|uniref:SDR family oxidoreductase n=1 Tax=Palleronia caenipelagi TaxID=2489174 RepID=A0A547Q633_9RHOB|nr:SDR family oxidoreductase [Palleronia caenipelagi]TRD21831.1 SDR family oxidoreductase [Palleronia caenipelagi]
MRLNGKVAIITGAVGGIGHALVAKFVSEGAKVLAVDLDEKAVAEFAAQYGDEVSGFAANVTDYAQVEGMMDAAVERFGTLDIVLNNAGIAPPKPLLEHDPEADWNAVTLVNQKGVYHGILAAARKLIALEKPGVILNTSSIYGSMAGEMTFSYNVSKAAVDMMTKSAALELAGHGIRVAAVAPGRVNTPMQEQAKALGIWNQMKIEQLRQEFTEPEEIANIFAFLASDEANAINGSTVDAEYGYLSFKLPLGVVQ